METLFDGDGGYNYFSFTGETGKWTIIGSESSGKSVWDTIDKFSSDDGRFIEMKRKNMKIKAENKDITPVLESKINFKTYSKKEWQKASGRSIKNKSPI